MAPGVLFDGSDTTATPPGVTANNDIPLPPPLPTSMNNGLPVWHERQRSLPEQSSMSDSPVCDQYTNLPAALLSSLKREKKPFTYTPGGIDLSEIKSPRMQKRLEANKRLQGVSPLAKQTDSSDQVKNELLVLPVYNSPLNLYSPQNFTDELQKQASLVTQELESIKLSSDGEHSRHNAELGYAPKLGQSRSFRLLQLMTDTTDDSPNSDNEPTIKHSEDDEMRFTGYNRDPVPSKIFHTLQRITGTDGSSPEPPPVIEYGEVVCPLQTPSYGRDFIPPPKSYMPFEDGHYQKKVEKMPNKISQIQIQVNVQENPIFQPNQSAYQNQIDNHQTKSIYQQNQPGGYSKTLGHAYKQKCPQPYVRPSFQTGNEYNSSNDWQSSSNPYNYCTLPRSYRGIPGLDGTDL